MKVTMTCRERKYMHETSMKEELLAFDNLGAVKDDGHPVN